MNNKKKYTVDIVLDDYDFMDAAELKEECRIFEAQRDDNLKRLILLRLSLDDLRGLGYTDAEVYETRDKLVLINYRDEIPIGGRR